MYMYCMWWFLCVLISKQKDVLAYSMVGIYKSTVWPNTLIPTHIHIEFYTHFWILPIDTLSIEQFIPRCNLYIWCAHMVPNRDNEVFLHLCPSKTEPAGPSGLRRGSSLSWGSTLPLSLVLASSWVNGSLVKEEVRASLFLGLSLGEKGALIKHCTSKSSVGANAKQTLLIVLRISYIYMYIICITDRTETSIALKTGNCHDKKYVKACTNITMDLSSSV